MFTPAPVTEPLKVIGRELHLDRLIGSGSFGEVYLAARIGLVANAKHNFTFPAECVVKVMRRGLCNEEEVAAMNREVATLSSMDHPYIVPYIGAWVEAARGKFFGCYCLAMKYCEGGDLHGFIAQCMNERRLPPADIAVRIMAQVFSALNYSHSRRLIHRDIKPGNVFLTLQKSGVPDKAMIGDYGLVRSLEASRQLVKTRVGTPSYISPEIAAGEAYGTKTDIFSAGTMFYELLSLHRPFWKRAMTEELLFREVLQRDPMPQFRKYTNSVYSTDLADVIEACLVKRENKRATAYDVLVRLTSPITLYVLKNTIPVYMEKSSPDLSSSSSPPAASSTSGCHGSAVQGVEAAATPHQWLERLFLLRKGATLGAKLSRLLSHNLELLFQIRVLVACRCDNAQHLESGLAELLWAFPDPFVPFHEITDLVLSDYRKLADELHVEAVLTRLVELVTMSSIAAKQVHRQQQLQPRLALPAGRIVSLEEGRRLAKLVQDEEDRLHSEATGLLEQKAATPVLLEESVSKRILLLRQKQNKKANVRAAVAYANRMHRRSSIQAEDATKMREAATRVLRPSSSVGNAGLRQRRQRAEQTKRQRQPPKGGKRH